MKINRRERGQALILIVFGMIVLIGMTGLAVDGGRAYSDRRNAQNAADAAALAAALANARQRDLNSAAMFSAFTNGYNDNGNTNVVSVTVTDSPSGVCEGGAAGKDITVQIVSHVNTMFAPVLGIRQLTNTVSTTTRSCGTYVAPMFSGNAIVALSPTGTDFSATGTPDWLIQNGGIFVNSNSSSAASCGGAAGVSAPSVTAVGGTSFSCSPSPAAGDIQTGVDPVHWSDYKLQFPPIPLCDGTAAPVGSQWVPQAGKYGSKVAFSGDMDFAPGLYCVTNSPGPFHGAITSSQGGVTFYILSSNFNMKFNGGGNLTAQAPSSGPYAGILMYLAPQVDSNGNLLHTQSIDMRGNGTGEIVGTILAPSADVTMYGNSGTTGFDTQIVAYQVSSGGNANITVDYNAANNYQTAQPISLAIIK